LLIQQPYTRSSFSMPPLRWAALGAALLRGSEHRWRLCGWKGRPHRSQMGSRTAPQRRRAARAGA
jgi:hypothetical protein